MKPSDMAPADVLDLARGFAKHARDWALAAGASGEVLDFVAAAAERVSVATAQGHVCVPLAAIAADTPDVSIEALRDRLFASRIVAAPGDAEVKPLILDAAGRLYLRRYFEYERRLAENLVRRAAAGASADTDAGMPGAKPDLQKAAVELAMRQRLTVVSGGPGTGKTTTVAILLARFLEWNPEARIALAAPTGKAAARMLESMRAAPRPDVLRERLPLESHTIHRLLGVTPEAGRFRHDAKNPLPVDLLVVDEASMLDLSLAAHLVDAAPENTHLVFLGDKDQLAAVEVGAVFADLSAKERSPLANNIVWFTESYRFAAESGIGRFAADINAGEPERALEWIAKSADASVAWIEDAGAALSSTIRARVLDGYGAYLETLRDKIDDKAAVFESFARFRVLCAVRESPRGVRALNRMLEQRARELLDPGGRSPWYRGRPVMVLRNDYVLRLFNGDIGICLPDEDGKLAVWFPGEGTTFRAIAPNRLPAIDDAWATTVHKAQGSEFDSLLCLLPEKSSPVMVRELLYTAVTRARSRVMLAGSKDVFREACGRRTQREAGLLERMREAAAQIRKR